jgi:hypothetical protein
MTVKMIGGKVYGANLTAKEREAINIEINKEIRRRSEQYANDVDSAILYQLRVQLGFGKKRLRKFYDGWKAAHDNLLEHYEMDKEDSSWLFMKKLKDIGVDVEEWNKESAT